jgi:hypothetical protein
MHQLSYHPDDWSHDLDQWWVPLAELADQADCASPSWVTVLGVGEFFDVCLLSQVHLRTPWLCLAASALAAAAARGWAAAGGGPGEPAETTARKLGLAAVHLAIDLQELRWAGGQLGGNVTSTAQLIEAGQAALAVSTGLPAADIPGPLSLAAGWLVRSGGTMTTVETGHVPSGPAAGPGDPAELAAQLMAAALEQRQDAGPVAWGTAHLVERLASGSREAATSSRRPDDLPRRAAANLLLVGEPSEVGVFEVRRRHSRLGPPPGAPVPDLAGLAFVHATADFVDSVGVAFAVADKAHRKSLDRPGELISWSLWLAHGLHPLAERTVSGRSAALGAYAAFRSLSELGVFTGDHVAFTGQLSPDDGSLGKVAGARGKIDAAAEHGIRLIVCPAGQEWQDPAGRVRLRPESTAEEAVIAATKSLRVLRTYLEAACQLVAPEPWLQKWLDNQEPRGVQAPLLDIVCRRVPHPPGQPARPGTPPGDRHPAGRDIPPCPAHLLASKHPDVSFVISADGGSGCTITAKRMVAEAARAAIDRLRATGVPRRRHPVTLPLYVPLGELVSEWDDLLEAAADALPTLRGSTLTISAALAEALVTETGSGWRALVVVDGTDRVPRSDEDTGREEIADFIRMITATGPEADHNWWPKRPARVVLCGRPSPAHLEAAQTLRARRPGAVAMMGLEPLSNEEIDRFVAAMPGGLPPLAGQARELARNPLLLAISVIADHVQAGEHGPVDLFHRAIDVLLGERVQDRRQLAELAFRAAVAKGEPSGDFTLADLARPGAGEATAAALASDDMPLAVATALGKDERDAFRRAGHDTHLLTASGDGWRFFHDRAFAFLVADRIARHALADEGTDEDHFAVTGRHLGDPFWGDVIEATGRLLELRAAADGLPRP